ncbi:MAG: hypothetical protein A3F67_05620 [Verrucomicrobia bacterium RIFCSPHIGHO2_12_FULL_41_10]|nr:MAG: hypothetical protein A3F67_05620 [Verrucomicrobia bacterium RIFCSPHIGHO2_12_FULL_41_10]
MDPMLPVALGKGAETLGEELGVFGKKASPSKPAITVTAVAFTPVESSAFSSSSAPSAMMSGKSVIEATAVPMRYETTAENSTAQFLEKEICDNIYLSCLAKVAAMSFAERTSVEGILNLSQEAKEWAAAEQKAKRDVEKSQQALEAATEEKKIVDKEIKMMLDDSTFHGGAVVTKAYRDFKIKELGEQLAKTRVETAKATLYAIQVKNTEQSAAAETDLTGAIAGEKKALQALEEAKSHAVESVSIPMAEAVAVEAMAIYPNNYSYQAYPHNQQFNPLNLSPERADQEEQKASAKKEKAAAAFEKEFSMMIESSKLQAEEAAEAATTSREKAEKSGTSEKAWKEALEEAEMTGEAYGHLAGLYEMYKEQAAEYYEGGMLKTKGSKYNFELKKAEKKKERWTIELEECRQKKEALKRGTLEKPLTQEQTSEMQAAKEREALLAQQAKEQEELKAQEKIRQIKLEAEAAIVREREALEMQKKKEEDEANQLAKQKELEKEKEIVLHKQALTQQEAEVRRLEAEAAAQAKTLVEESKVIEASEALVNSVNPSVECVTGSTNHQSVFNDASNSKPLLPSPTAAAVSQPTAYSLQPMASIIEDDKKLIETWQAMMTDMLEKRGRVNAVGSTDEGGKGTSVSSQLYYAIEKLKEAIKAESAGKSEEARGWREAAEYYRRSVEFRAEAARAYEQEKTEEGKSWNYAGDCFLKAERELEKTIVAENAGKPEEALKWREAAEQYKHAGELYIQSARAYARGKEDEGASWYHAGQHFDNAVIKLGKAIVAKSAGKPEEAEKWSEAAEQYKYAGELFIQSARAYGQGKTTEAKSWNDGANVLRSGALALEDALKAEAKGKVAEAQTLREEAAKYQQKAEDCQRAAEAAVQANILAEESKATAAVETLVNLSDLSVECATGLTNHQSDSNRLFFKTRLC